MLKIISYNLDKNAINQDEISLNDTERKIFAFIQKATQHIPGTPVSRVAGGWVRDKLLGKVSKDIDITVEGMEGVEFANHLKAFAVQRYGPQQNVVSRIKDTEARPEQIKNLAVAFLRLFGEDVEILNVRGNEVYEPGSRNPISTDFNATPQQDAHRRDLTINSMFYNIITGEVEDFTGKGKSDLGVQRSSSEFQEGWNEIPNKIILRTPLNPIETFKDDPLRMLRIIRFHSRYLNSEISPEVVEAMADPEVQHNIVRKMHDPNETMGIVTERTAEEFRKIMMGEQPDQAIGIMLKTGLLQKMLNLPAEFHPLNMEQMSNFHSLNVIDHTVQVVKNMNNVSKEFEFSNNERSMMNIASLFHDLGKLDPRSHKTKPDGTRGYSGNPDDPTGISHQQSSADVFKGFATAIGLTNKETDFIHTVVMHHMDPHNHVEKGRATDRQLRRFRGKHPDMWKFLSAHAVADARSKEIPSNMESGEPYLENIRRMEDPGLFPQQLSGQDLLNGKEIIDIVKLPAKPPIAQPGQPPVRGYIEVVKDKIREEQYGNPELTKQQAVVVVQQMLANGELDMYSV